MRTVARLTLYGFTFLLTGCNSDPATPAVSAKRSLAPALYQSLSGLFNQCEGASRRYDYAAASITTTKRFRSATFAAANEEERLCSQSANSMLKLEAIRLPAEEENVAFATSVKACVSEATDKASAGNSAKAHVDGVRSPVIGSADSQPGMKGPSSPCTTALAAFANIAGFAPQ